MIKVEMQPAGRKLIEGRLVWALTITVVINPLHSKF